MTELFPSSRPWVIAGPCSAESEDQVMATASALKERGIAVFRAGLWKPRTYPGCFEGVGEEGLPWLRRVRDELGMKVCTEVAGAQHVRACLEAGLDLLWVGARTTANPFLVQEIAEALGGSGVPVLVKNPINPDLELWTGAIERFLRCGVTDLGVVHRGFSTFDRIKYRNAPFWQHAIGMRSRYPRIPFFCDPSHMSGCTGYIQEISQHALDLGLDGLMIESHCDPARALSDSVQQLTPAELGELLSSLSVRENDSSDEGYKESLARFRERIDVIDDDLVRLLGERMEISREIGRYKKANNIAIIQTTRWEEVMEAAARAASACNLDEEFLKRIFNAIHEASAAEQNKIISEQ